MQVLSLYYINRYRKGISYPLFRYYLYNHYPLGHKPCPFFANFPICVFFSIVH